MIIYNDQFSQLLLSLCLMIVSVEEGTFINRLKLGLQP